MGEDKGLRIICSGGTSFPLLKAVERFRERTGIPVDPVVGKAHLLYAETRARRDADLFHIGAQYQADVAEVEGCIVKPSRTVLGFRRAVIAVPKGNPKAIVGLSDLAREGVSLSVCAAGCLAGIWDDVCGRTRDLALVRGLLANIRSYSDGCIGNCNKLIQREADASIGWNVFGVAFPRHIDCIELPPELQIRRATNVSRFEFARHRAEAEAFLAFLATPEAREIYRDCGWEVD